MGLEIKIREWIGKFNANQLRNFILLVQKVSGFNFGIDERSDVSDWLPPDSVKKRGLIAVVATMLTQLENIKNSFTNFKTPIPFVEVSKRAQANFEFLPKQTIKILVNETKNTARAEVNDMLEKLNHLFQNIHQVDQQITGAMEKQQRLHEKVSDLEQQVKQARENLVTARYQAVPVNRQQSVQAVAPQAGVTIPTAAFIPTNYHPTYKTVFKPSVMRNYQPKKMEEKQTLEKVEKDLGKKLEKKKQALETNTQHVISLHEERIRWVQDTVNLILVLKNQPRSSVYQKIAELLLNAPRLSGVEDFNNDMDEIYNLPTTARVEVAFS